MHITFVHSHYENLGIEYISAVLKRAGHKTDLVFEPALFHNFFSENSFLDKIFNFKEYILKEIEKRNPEIVSFSVIADNYQWTLDIAKEVKAFSKATIIFGGIHPTSVPDSVLKDGVADYIVIGEAEEAFLELVECIESKKSVQDVLNVGFCTEDKVVVNKVREPIADLDSLPFPDKDLFFQEYPRMIFGSYMILGSRGCANKCSYCWNSTIHRLYGGNKYFRRRSPENVIKELEWAKNRYKIKKVTFYDEVFTYDKEWLKQFLLQYMEKVQLPYFCCIHPSDVDEEIILLLERSGCSAVNIGMQTANEETRKQVLHRKGSNQGIKDALALLRKTKIFVYSNIILGLPGEEEKDVVATARFCIENKVDMPAIYWLRYYPGTEIIDIARKQGMLTDDNIEKINESKEYSPYAISGNTYNKNIAKLGNLILLSGILSKKTLYFFLGNNRYKYLPSQNLLFPLIVFSCFVQRLFKGKKHTFHYFNIIDYFLYYASYLLKRIKRCFLGKVF